MLRFQFVAACCVAFLASQAITPIGEDLTFHHLHLVTFNTETTLSFYQRLFPVSATQRVRVLDTDGVQQNDVYLLASVGGREALEQSTPFWHLGWGRTSLGETYRAHLLNEVKWDLPIPGLTWNWHVHVLTPAPADAAAWYERMLGGSAVVAAQPQVGVANAYPVRAIVRWPTISLVFHAWDDSQPVDRTIGQRIDHVAFGTTDLAAAVGRLEAAGVQFLNAPTNEAPGAFMRGPDGALLEIVPLDSPRQSSASRDPERHPRAELPSIE